MKTLNGQELELFRAGDYGAKGRYTPADLQTLAANYDPTKHEVPLCIGHPKLNAPAFGWLKSLRASGDMLFGTFDKVVPAFDQAVQDGLYKKRSVALARNADGTLDLRHVGYLGAMLPEVRGLADASFSSDSYEEIEFSNEPQGEIMAEDLKKSIFDGLTEFFSGWKGKPATLSSEDLATLQANIEAKFAADLKAKDDKIVALESKFSAQQSGDATARRVEAAINGLKASNHWVPAFDKMGVPEIFAALAASASQEITFSDGASETKLDPVSAFAKFLNGLRKLVPEGITFAESSSKSVASPTPENAGPVDPGSVAFNERVNAFAEEKNVSYIDAYKALRAKGDGPEAGAATAGAV